jgi:hypothetical protein
VTTVDEQQPVRTEEFSALGEICPTKKAAASPTFWLERRGQAASAPMNVGVPNP